MNEPSKWVGCQECDVTFQCYDGATSCIRLPTIVISRPIYKIGNIVVHLRSDRLYQIITSPITVRIEASNTPAYIYVEYKKKDAISWVRSQVEMEDGRFRLFADK